MKQLQLQYKNGRYLAEIDISVEEWKTMLADKTIFDQDSLDMVIKWYSQTNHQSTHKTIMENYPDEYSKHKRTPFNGIVAGLAQRIIKYLNRFKVIGTTGKNSYFIIPFEGWTEETGLFVWKLREELVQALEELNLLEDVFIPVNEELESIVLEEGNTEGRIVMYYTTKYERSQENRNNAVKIHGLSCCVCDFNFENFYGALGKNYIEVHHLKPLYSRDEEVIPNVETDLVCLCSNCHRMLHRSKSDIMTPDELKFIIKENL